jgi:hypothetical protein
MSTTRLIRGPLDAPVPSVRPTGLSGMLGLLERLDAARWCTLPDLPWTGRPPGTRGRVVIGPTGVFLLTDHPWTGAVTVQDAQVCVEGRSRDLHVGDVAEAAASVAALLPVDLRPHVRAVLCLTRQAGLDLVSRAVAVCAPDSLGEVLTGGPRVLRRGHRDDAEAVVRAAMRRETEGPAAGPGPSVRAVSPVPSLSRV